MTLMRRSPIEMMVDQACGYDPNAEDEKITPRPPEEILLTLADASTDWYKDESAVNFERMKKSIKEWIDIST